MKITDANGNPVKESQQKEERLKCPLKEKVIELLIKQLEHELSNYMLYKSYSNLSNSEGLFMLEKYYNGRANEEYKHYSWVAEYLTDHDVRFDYPTVLPSNDVTDDILQTFADTIAREVLTTEMIENIAKVALEEGDYMTFAWLGSNDPDKGMLLLEQVEEESISRNFYEIAKKDEPWLIKEETIYSIYSND